MEIRNWEDLVAVDDHGNIVQRNVVFDARTLNLAAASANSGVIEATATTLPGTLDGTEEADLIEVSLVAGQTYTFDYRGAPGGVVDPFLALFGPGFTYITEDDDGGAGRGSMITYTPTVSGTYTLYATSFYTIGEGAAPSFDAGDYTISIWSPETDVPGSTNVLASIGSAVEISLGTTFGNLDVEGDNDYFALDVRAGMVYSFGYAGGVWGAADRNGEAGENLATLSVYNAAGTLLSSNFNYESATSYYAATDTTIYLRVAGSNEPALGGTGGFTLDVTEIDPSTRDPLESLRWDSADNIDTVLVDGVPTAYVYFGAAGETFGETNPNGTPLTTSGWTQAQISAVMSALENEYTPITGIDYVITNDVSQAEFRMLTVPTATYGARFYPQDPAYGTQQGIGTFNLASGGFGAFPQSLEEGGFSYAVILHEFGHAHGIAHPHDGGGGSEIMLGVTGATGSLGVYDLNQGVYTVMSYNDAWQLHPDGMYDGLYVSAIDNGWSSSLSAFDIAVLQERYGTHAYNTGDNVYALTDVVNDASYQTIWDTGGTDTIAYSGALDARIDLTAATLDYSATGGGVLSFLLNDPAVVASTPEQNLLRGGYTIANGVVIENATGGSGDDVLLGNSAANVLTGNDGNDTLMGRGGSDVLNGGAGSDVLNGGLGTDELIGGAGSDIFVFDDVSMDKIRDFDSGVDRIDLSAFGIDFSAIRINGNNLFADTDGNSSYDLHIVVQGERVRSSDIIFESEASTTHSSVSTTSAALGASDWAGLYLLNASAPHEYLV